MNSVLFFGLRFLPYFSLICPTLLLSTHLANDFLSVPSFLWRSLPCLGYLIDVSMERFIRQKPYQLQETKQVT